MDWYYLCSEIKGVDQLPQLICRAIVLAYAKTGFLMTGLKLCPQKKSLKSIVASNLDNVHIGMYDVI